MKPLHISVAQAIGENVDDDGHYPSHCKNGPGCPCGGIGPEALRYDTDWSATGPLINKYVRLIERIHDFGPVAWGARYWGEFGELDEVIGNGPTLLVAVCNLILALAEAGKLPKP